MADEWQAYVNDSKTVCRYGARCYQKNPEHHQKFKHPPQTTRKDVHRHKRRFSPYTRDSPRHSPNPHGKDESPSNDDKEKAPNEAGAGSKEKETNEEDTDTKEKPVNDEPAIPLNFDSRDKSEEPEVPKPESVEHKTIKLPENITYYDKSTDSNLFKELFLVEMPEDFFKFFDCISDCGKSVEDTLGSVNLMPIGPYDLLLGKLPKLDDKELYLTHWRFFYDPPEFQAVLKKKKNSEYHIGYFRDDPEQKPAFVGSNDSEKDYHITPLALNIFGAFYIYLQNEKKHSPFTAMSCIKLIDKIKAYAEKNNISLEEFSMKKRSSHTVTRSFHGAGIVVPYNKNTQLGYRRLVETDANLKKLFANLEKAKSQNEKDKLLSDLQPVITYASIAVDECDFGTGLEVGIALFCSGLKELEPSSMNSLTAAYSVLNRPSFGEIIKAHLKYRRKGPNVSVLHVE